MTRHSFIAAAVAAAGLALGANAFAQGPQPEAEGLSLAEIENRATQRGLRVEEIEIEGRLVEVEGRDAQGREVELIFDRYTGEVLSEKFDD